MYKKMSLPVVLIVGRTNVGKSTLFNRLSTTVKSLTLDYKGVTRDFVTDVVCWSDRCFTLIDSGGVDLKKTEDYLAERVRQTTLTVINDADVVLLVCDGTIGPVNADREIAKLLHKQGKQTILVVNKEDSKIVEEHRYEFKQLGFSSILFISAQHATGIGELLDAIKLLLPAATTKTVEQDVAFSITLLGKPNVGKSSLMNALLEQERVLVAEKAGTTREAITEPIRFYQETIQLTDTPGVRRKRTVEESLEKMMVKTSFRAVKHANIVLLVLDGSQLFSDQELKLGFYVFEEGKALIILLNKVDLVDEQMRLQWEDQVQRYGYLLNKVPHLFVSCLTKKNIGKIMPLVAQVWERHSHRFADNELTILFKEALQATPLFHQSEPLMLSRAVQIGAAPITILLRVNKPAWFGQSQLAFFENKLRGHYDLKGVPVVFVVR